MSLSEQSQQKLKGVHPVMQAVVRRAASYKILPFMVVNMMGKESGQRDGYKWSVNLVPDEVNMASAIRGGQNDMILFGVLGALMLRSAQEIGCEIKWSGGENPIDLMYFELIREEK